MSAACFLTITAGHVIVLVFAVFLLRQFGQGLMSHAALTSMARHFERDCGKAISIANLGFPTGQAAFPIIAVSVVAAALLGVAKSPDAPDSLAVYFDGHKYLEIAKSFPFAYAEEGRELLGHAPGYPAVIALARWILPEAVGWGYASLLVAWVCGALASVAFYGLCRATGVAPLVPSLIFACANPRWIAVSSTAHAEPLAMLLVLLCFVAWLRGSLGWAVAWLALAALTRFPAIILGLPLAWDVLRRDRTPGRFALLSIPPLVLILFETQLRLRIPGFEGVSAAHAFWWDVQWGVPFFGLIRHPNVFPDGFALRELSRKFLCFPSLRSAITTMRASRPI